MFGNYPNMEHCAIENTVKSMTQVLNGFDEVRTTEEAQELLEGLNQYEKRAYEQLMEMAEALASETARIDNLADEASDDEEE